MQQLQTTLAKRLSDPALSSDEVLRLSVSYQQCLWLHRLTDTVCGLQICEAVSLLNQLDACSDDMRQQFLDWHQTHFEQQLAAFATNSDSTTTDESVLAFLQRLHAHVLSKLENVFRVYRANFLPELVEKEQRGVLRASSALHDDAFITFARDLFALYLRVCARQFRRPHHEFVRRTAGSGSVARVL